MDELVIAGKKFKSRLITGTGKHRSSKDLHDSIIASETEMITVAIRRINFDDPKEKSLIFRKSQSNLQKKVMISCRGLFRS